MILLAAFQGFIVSLGLIIAIGPQNAFLLRQGLKQDQVFKIASICFGCDAILLFAGVYGAGGLFAANPALAMGMRLVGIGFLCLYASMLFYTAWRPGALRVDQVGPVGVQMRPANGVVLAAFGFCLLNPQAYVDTLLVIGGLSSAYSEMAERTAFGLGAVLGSAIWFFGLAMGARSLGPFLQSKRAWQWIDFGLAIFVGSIAVFLAFQTFT